MRFLVSNLLILALIVTSVPAIAGSQAASSGSGSSSATMDADTKTAADYQTCLKMLDNYNNCSKPSAGTPSEEGDVKSCQEKNIPTFISGNAYAAPGAKFDGKFEAWDCEQERNKATSTAENFEANENKASMLEILFLLVTAYGGVSNGVCLATGGPAGWKIFDMWIHAAVSTTYLAGEVALLLAHRKDMEELSKFEDKAYDEKKGGKSINDVDANENTQLDSFKKFKEAAERTKTAFETKRTLMYVVATGYAIAAASSIAIYFIDSVPVVGQANSASKDVVLGRCGTVTVGATSKLPSNSLFADLENKLIGNFISEANAANNSQSGLVPGWGLLTGGLAAGVIASAFLLRKKLNISGYLPWLAGDMARFIIYGANSALAFMIASNISGDDGPIGKLEKRIKVLDGIIAKLEKLTNTALGTVENNLVSATSNLNVGLNASVNAGGLSVESAASIKYSSKSVLDTPDGIDCSKDSNPAECKKTVSEVANQLNSTFSESNMGSLNMAIDSAKLSPLLAGTLKNGVNGLRSAAMSIGGKNAIGTGNKFVSDFDKKIKEQKLNLANSLNAKLVKDGKAAIDFDAESKKHLAAVKKAEADLSPSQKSDLAKSSLGGLPSISGPTTVTPARDLNPIEAPAMVTTTAEPPVEESIGGDSSSAASDEQLPNTPKVFTEKSFDNFVNEVKERKHDRADADSLFSILNKAYKRNAYPVLLKPKKAKVKVDVPPPQS